MGDYGLVSVITPAYNSAKFIAETIESVLAQTYPYWEMIITDDCSTDNTCEIIEGYAEKDPRIKLICLDKNSGAGVARNTSIKAAKGRFIAFCDSDDRWYPEKLERQIVFMKEKDCALSYTSYDVCDEDGKIFGFVECLPSLNNSKILRNNSIGCLTSIYDTEKIGKRYMPELRKRQDWCLWMEIIAACKKAYGIQEPLALYRDRAKSISSNKIEMLKYNYQVYHSFLKKNHIVAGSYLVFRFLPYYFYKKFKQKQDYKKHLSKN